LAMILQYHTAHYCSPRRRKIKVRGAILRHQAQRYSETVVLGEPRGPKTEMRIEANDVTAIVELAGLLLNRTVELPPYHYGFVFRRRSE
jgi:hypothetical protein